MAIRKQRVVSGDCCVVGPPKNRTTARPRRLIAPFATESGQGRAEGAGPYRNRGEWLEEAKRACERNTEITETGRGERRGSNGAGERKGLSLSGWFAELSKSASALVERPGDFCRHNHADRLWRGFQAGREYRIGPGTRRCPLGELPVGSYVAPLCCAAIPPRLACNRSRKERPG